VIALEQIDLTAAQKADTRQYLTESMFVRIAGRDCARRDTKGAQYCRIVFAFIAFVVASIALRALGGVSPALRPSAENALPFFLGLMAILVGGYIIGKALPAFVQRSKVRFLFDNFAFISKVLS
jgi:hypothetical protein